MEERPPVAGFEPSFTRPLPPPLPALPSSPPSLPAAAIARPAGFWRRWAAVMVDTLILWFPLATLRVALGRPLFVPAWEVTGVDVALMGLGLLVAWIYTAWLDASAAQGTLGKQLLAIRVERTDGTRLSFARASVRHLASWLSLFTLGIGFLMNLWTRRRQTLHDLIAGAVLVRWEPPASRETA